MTLMPSASLPTAFIDAPFIQVDRISVSPFRLYAEKPSVAPGITIWTGAVGRRIPLWIWLISYASYFHGRYERFGIGFTLTHAKPRGKELIDRVEDVTRYIMTNAKAKGYDMPHVGDDPERYAVSPELNRKHDGVCTSWVICSKLI